MGRHRSYGTCEICGIRIAKAAMTAHLRACAPREEKASKVEALLIRVLARGTPPYWIDCAIRIDANLKHLDTLLRRMWLECCGHRSEFFVDRRRPASMSASVQRALTMAGGQLGYVYDFGSTTALEVSATGTVEVALGSPIRLLARNEPPVWPCEVCGAPATETCVQCVYEDHGCCCATHAQTHACGPDMLRPVVNSPRMGVCGYSGE